MVSENSDKFSGLDEQLESSNTSLQLQTSKNFNKKLIKVMVASPVQPSRLADLEEMTVEGLARPPGGTINLKVYNAWRHKGFEFDEKFVLIESFATPPEAAN